MADRFGLDKLQSKLAQNKIDVGDSAKLKAIVKEADAVDDLIEDAQTSARKVSNAMKRGSQPDIKSYTVARKAAVDRAKRMEAAVGQFTDTLSKKQQEAKKAGKSDATKLIAELDKQLDAFADVLAETRKLPKPEELMLALLSNRMSIGKGDKDDTIKRAGKIDEKSPGTSFFHEIERMSKDAGDYDLKPITKHKNAIKGLDIIVENSKKFDKEVRALDDFVKKPSAKPDASLIKSVQEMTKLLKDAEAAWQNVAPIEKAVEKLPAKSDRDKSIAKSLGKSWEDTVDALKDARRTFEKYSTPKTAPIETFRKAYKAAEQATARNA